MVVYVLTLDGYVLGVFKSLEATLGTLGRPVVPDLELPRLSVPATVDLMDGLRFAFDAGEPHVTLVYPSGVEMELTKMEVS